MKPHTLRKSTPDDFKFLRHVHHTTLQGYISKIWGWDESFQDKLFQDSFDPDFFEIVVLENKSVGYLELNQKDRSIKICNLLILPEFQGAGLGTKIIQNLILKAQKQNLDLQLGVFKLNTRAKKLYDKLGFQTFEETETHYYYENRSWHTAMFVTFY